MICSRKVEPTRAVILTVLFLFAVVLNQTSVNAILLAMDRMPDADGYFHLYALPVGQGSANVLQCPNGDIAIIDLGSAEGQDNEFWSTEEIKAFLQGHNSRIKNIVITHNDKDHYSFLNEAFSSSSGLSGLDNIYITHTPEHLPDILRNWINNIGASNKLRTFNGGRTCGSSNKKSCENIILCPGNTEIVTRVLSANAADCTTSTKKNIDSIVIGIKFNTFTMQLNGDFEDCTTDQNENGPQKKMVDFYGNLLQATVYMLAHHGADSCANKRVMLNAVKPKAVFASSNPWFKSRWRHPRCSITDYLIQEEYLCKPGEIDPSSSFYCGQHPRNDLNLKYRLQKEFTCGACHPDQPDKCYDEVRTNDVAIYSTTPSEKEINLVHLLTDGDKWGFINNFQPRLTSLHLNE